LPNYDAQAEVHRTQNRHPALNGLARKGLPPLPEHTATAMDCIQWMMAQANDYPNALWLTVPLEAGFGKKKLHYGEIVRMLFSLAVRKCADYAREHSDCFVEAGALLVGDQRQARSREIELCADRMEKSANYAEFEVEMRHLHKLGAFLRDDDVDLVSRTDPRDPIELSPATIAELLQYAPVRPLRSA
jgi:hypothetical protein